jgi:hypothetical protein
MGGAQEPREVKDVPTEEDEKAGHGATGVAIIRVMFNEIAEDFFYPALVCNQGIAA